jgi:hypothetical protein
VRDSELEKGVVSAVWKKSALNARSLDYIEPKAGITANHAMFLCVGFGLTA